MMVQAIDTVSFAQAMRERIIRPSSREVLIAKLAGSDQEQDLTLPANCEGLGRVRHFNRVGSWGWPENPLPIDPASKALGFPRANRLQAQVFQNAACAWRCWYCYVPYNLLSGDSSRGRWMTTDALVELYAAEPSAPVVIDLSGGSPDLTPEWIPWMMRSLRTAGLSEKTYLWSDDNLSTDYVFTMLSGEDRRTLIEYRNYGRVCCVKGFDTESFSFNTTATPEGYEKQFDVLARYLNLGIDLYGYVTLTGPDPEAAKTGVPHLLDRLQALSECLPLRFVPLEIVSFTPTDKRSKADGLRSGTADRVQREAVEIWSRELQRRYSKHELGLNIADVPIQ
jgi:uncharacterized Fe-S cluster-containing radical SAM superfamily protein